jgi:hypothetical protein
VHARACEGIDAVKRVRRRRVADPSFRYESEFESESVEECSVQAGRGVKKSVRVNPCDAPREDAELIVPVTRKKRKTDSDSIPTPTTKKLKTSPIG